MTSPWRDLGFPSWPRGTSGASCSKTLVNTNPFRSLVINLGCHDSSGPPALPTLLERRIVMAVSPASERSRLYMSAAAARSAEQRAARLHSLRMHRGQIIQASEFMRRVARVSGLQTVVLRAGMVWTDPRSVLLKPPLSTLASRHEEALRLYLHAIFLAQALENPGDVHTGFQRTLAAGSVPGLTWSRLLAMKGSHRNTVLRVQRSMRALQQYGLAEIPNVGARPDYSGFRILSEDGQGEPYRCPGGPSSNLSRGLQLGADEFAVPASLFVNGWSLVLSVPEVAMILLFNLLERKYGLQNRHVFISRASRLRSSGLSDEVYLVS